jgi:hypothetical protein
VIQVLTFSVYVRGDRAGIERATATRAECTILGSLKIVLVVPCLQIYCVTFALVVIRLVEIDDGIPQVRRDKVIAPVIDHETVNYGVTVEVVMLDKVLQGC